MKQNIYEIFHLSFPQLAISKEQFERKIHLSSCQCLTAEEDGKLVGFSLIQGNTVMLLCVLSEFRGKGIGSKLLSQSEDAIKQAGFQRAVLGLGEHTYLFQGVPMFCEETVHFFEKRGYKADEISVDMSMPLGTFSKDKCSIRSCAGDVSFRYVTPEEHEQLLSAVKQAEPDWTHYFEHTSCPVLVAVENGEILGFCIVDPDGAPLFADTGEIGCVGVIPSARKRGIGLQMVAAATEELQRKGCKNGFLGFTYLEHWYAKLGYRACIRYWMGEKELD